MTLSRVDASPGVGVLWYTASKDGLLWVDVLVTRLVVEGVVPTSNTATPSPSAPAVTVGAPEEGWTTKSSLTEGTEGTSGVTSIASPPPPPSSKGTIAGSSAVTVGVRSTVTPIVSVGIAGRGTTGLEVPALTSTPIGLYPVVPPVPFPVPMLRPPK
ncbi:asORF [Canis familiaris papillomavirus 19]|uniref:AsORF n=1 Tax=Canis familiaris papillomavirus 19 TaxID=2759773 RepID=A0A1C9J6Q5_9PAPI|nr:asORF [Canis familiaris papillomavirus 19]